MRLFSPRSSISRKLALLVLAAVAAGLVAATALSVWQDAHRYARTRQAALLAVAQVFASATATAVAGNDQTGALHAMRAIGRIPGLIHARIETPRGRLAELGFAVQLESDLRLDERIDQPVPVWQLLGSRSMEVAVPIVNAGEPVGRLVLVGDISDLPAQLFGTLRLSALGGLIALALGLVIAARLQRGITAPLRRLTDTMGRVRESHDYSALVEPASNDEVGVLLDGFNAMLGEIRERDARIDAHLRSLEQQVADRTRELRGARDVAEAASAAKSDFLATMSHEIRTPMNGIMVMAELLAAGDLPNRQRRYADIIAKSGESLLAIINDILDFSKIESGKLEVESIEVDPAALADDVTSLFGERARAKNLDIAACVSPDTPARIAGDPVRLNQILGNLVNNALKFTEHGHVLLTIGPDRMQAGRLRFAVADTGIGIAPDKVDMIFSAFSQADQTTTRRFGGTGLGLAICKRLIEAMDGEIEVTSEVGHGSVFAFTIPMGLSAQPGAWPRLPALSNGRRAALALSGEATSTAVAAYLAAAGYSTIDLDHAPFDADTVALVVADAARVADIAPDPARAGLPPVLCLAGMGDPQGEQLVRSGRAAAALTRPLVRAELLHVLTCIADGKSLAEIDARAGRAEPTLPRFAALSVLVADDSAVNREVVLEALSRLGARAEIAGNGREAVAAVASRRYDIVLMDGSMPEMDGFEASRRIRAAERATGAPRLPIVALTAHVVGTAADAWRDAGMDAVVHKPFTIRALADCFVRLLPQMQEGRVAATAVAPACPVAPEASAQPTNESSDHPVLDPAMLAQFDELARGGREEFVARVCGLYIEHAPQTAAQLKAALGARDPEGIGRAAHALKSMSYNIGAARLAALAGSVERQARIDGVTISERDQLALFDTLELTLAAVCARGHPRVSPRSAAAAW